MSALAYFGQQPLDFLGDFEHDADSDPTDLGLSIRLRGVVKKPVGEYLKELCDNRERRVTYGPHVGVLETVWIQNRPQLSGNYLLQRCDTSADHLQQLRGWLAFSLDAVQLVSRDLMLTHSSRARDNDFGITGRSIVVQPFWGENPNGQPFDTDPGGTPFTREYDSRTEYDADDLTNTPRFLRINAGTAS